MTLVLHGPSTNPALPQITPEALATNINSELTTFWLPLTSGTLSQPLTLPATVTNPLHAATKDYVDTHIPAGGPFLPISGGTLTGALTLSGSPITLPLHAASKQYVDTTSAAAGVTKFNTRQGDVVLLSADVTGALTFTPYNATNPANYITVTQSNAAIAAAAYVLPTATTTLLGGVKIDGTTITIASGVISGSAATGTTPLMAGVPNVGTETLWARGDHRHPTDATKIGDAPSDGIYYVRQNALWTALLPAAATPLVDAGTGSVGVSLLYARQDHYHPTDTSRAPLASPDFTGTPLSITPTVGDSTRKIATTEFVTASMSAAGVIAEAPSDSQYYSRRNAAWTVSPGGLTDAPNDTSTYGRGAATWKAVLPITGGTLTGALTATGQVTIGGGANNAIQFLAGATSADPALMQMSSTTGGLSSNGPLFLQTNAGSTATQFVMTNYYVPAGNTIIGDLRSGSPGAPANISGGNRPILSLQARGWGGGVTTARAAINMVTSTSWSPTSQGTFIDFQVTPSGSTTMATAMRLQTNGQLTIGSSTSFGNYRLYVTGGGNVFFDAPNLYISPGAGAANLQMQSQTGLASIYMTGSSGSNVIFSTGATTADPIRFWINNSPGILIDKALTVWGVTTLGLDPVNPLEAVTKQYSDAKSIGTVTNDDAAAGMIGEYISSETSPGSTTLTSSVLATITTIALTAGDWEVSATILFQPNASTSVTTYVAALNTFAAIPGVPNQGGVTQLAYAASVPAGLPTNVKVSRRFSLAATVTISLLASSTFTISTMGASGFIGARRVR